MVLVSNLIQLWSEKIIIYNFYLCNMFRCVLWPRFKSICNASCKLEKHVYSAIVGRGVLYILISSYWLKILFRLAVSLLILCLLEILIMERCIELYKYNNSFSLHVFLRPFASSGAFLKLPHWHKLSCSGKKHFLNNKIPISPLWFWSIFNNWRQETKY